MLLTYYTCKTSPIQHLQVTHQTMQAGQLQLSALAYLLLKMKVAEMIKTTVRIPSQKCINLHTQKFFSYVEAKVDTQDDWMNIGDQ